MKFLSSNTAIIIGTSDCLFLDKDIINNLKRVCLQYFTVGLNLSGNFLSFVDVISSCERTYFKYLEKWYDIMQLECDKDKVILAQKESINFDFKLKDKVIYDYSFCKFINTNIEDRRLFFTTSVLHPTINYLIKLEFKNIILIGIELPYLWKRFDGSIVRQPQFFVNEARNTLYNFSDYANLYCCNKNTFLQQCIKTINIKDIN